MIYSFISQIFLDFIYIIIFISKNNKGENLLFVRLDGVGDSVIWLNSFYNFEINKEKYNKIILVTRNEYEEFYKKSKIFNEIVGIDLLKFKSSFRYRIKIYQIIRNLNIKTAVNPVYSNILDSFNDSIIFSSKAKIRIIGPTYISQSKIAKYIRLIKELVYNKKLDFSHNINNHEIFYNLNIFKSLNFKLTKNFKLLSFDVLQEIPKLFNKNYIVIAPGSSSVIKNWPIERFIIIIKYLKKFNHQIICIGSKSEELECKLIEEECDIINLCGKTNLIEMCSVISNSKLVISNDTSSIHIAAACKVPSICITWGAGNGRFLPYPQIDEIKNFKNPQIIHNYKECVNCKNDCVNLYNNHYANCLNLIDVDIVLNKIEEFFNNSF